MKDCEVSVDMIFDCPNREKCESMGVLVDSECIVYCGLYETHRVKKLEEIAKDMFMSMADPLKFANSTGDKYIRDGHYQWTEIFREQLEALGVSLDD